MLDGLQAKMNVFDTEGNFLRTLVEGGGGTPDGICVDPLGRQIYWTNMGEHWDQADGFIERVNFDGSDRRIVIPKGATTTPKQMELDLENGLMYWCDREGMRVMRSRLDGSAITTLIVAGLGKEDQKDERRHCVGIAVDHQRKQLYWTQKGPPNSGTGRIFRAGLELPEGGPANRPDVELFLDGLPEPIDLEIDPSGDELYWTDRGDPPKGNSLNRISIGNGAWDGDEVLTAQFKEAIGLALDVKNDRVFITDLSGSIYRCHLDGFERKLIYKGRVGQGFTGIAYVEEGID